MTEDSLISPDLLAIMQCPLCTGELAEQARSEVAAEGVDPASIDIRRRIVNLRLMGQETALAIDQTPLPTEPAP